LPNGLAGDYDHGVEAVTPIQSPLSSFSITTADIPPLTPGRHYIQVMNLDAVSANYVLYANFTYDLASTAQRTTPQRSLVTITDDAQTATNQSEIIASAIPAVPGTVFAPGLVAGVRVGVRIAHPRPSDLVLRISNPERSVLLAENRGGLVNTNGYGWGTNVNEIIYTHFSDNTAVASQMMKFVDPLVDSNFVHFVTPSLVAVNRLEDIPSTLITTVNGNSSTPTGRLIDTGQTAGQIRIRYMFYTAQDSLSLYDSSGNPMPAGNPTPNQILVNEDNEPALAVAPGDVDIVTDTINLSSAGFVDGAEVSFFGGGPGGLSARVRYFIVNTTATSFQLSLTSGGPPVDITSTSPFTFGLYLWEATPMIPYTSADGVLNIIVNELTGVPGTGWDYIIELFDTGGVPVTPPATAAANQTLHRVVHAGTNLYVTGTTEANGNNGIYARFGLPMQTDQTPFESVNWPDNAGGTRFRDLIYASNSATTAKIYVAGDSFTGTTDNTGAKETKGVVVRFPDVGLNTLDPLGSDWSVSVPGVTGVEGLEEMHAIIPNLEGAAPGTLYLYAAGNAETASSTSRLKVVKLDDSGTLPLINVFEDDVGATVSAGRGIAVMSNLTATAQSVFVAGFSDDDGTMRPVMFKFDTALVEISRQALPVVGQFNGLIAYDGYLYAVGVQDALSGSGANFLIVKYDYDLNVVWSTVGIPAFDLGDEDILYGVTAAGNRLYAVGSTVSGGAPTDGVMLEVWLGDGTLVTRPAELYTGITRYDVTGVSGADSFRDVVMEGSDVYVVGDTTRAIGVNKDALILRYHVKDDYLPEEPLDNFIGDVAAGVWRLEVIDTRTNNYAGSPVVPRIIDWELQLFLADTNVTTFRLDNGVDFINSIRGQQVQYFVINAPMTASSVDHTLTVTAGAGLGLSLYYDPAGPPVITPANQLMTGVTGTQVNTLTRTTSPQLVPGQRYFLAVRNDNPNTVVTDYTLNVTFDSSATTFLASGTPQTDSFSDAPNIYQAYQFLIPTTDNYAVFELSDLTGDVEVRLRRGKPASESSYDILTTFTGTNYGTIVIAPTGTMPDVSGFWYALVKSLSGPSTSYQVSIKPPNHAPLLDPLANVSVNEGSQLVVQAYAFDNDVPKNVLTYSFGSEVPAGMVINPDTGVITWTPSEAQGPSVHNVTVRVTDNGLPVMFAEQQFTVSALEVNSAPSLATANYSVAEGTLFAPIIQATDADLPANSISYSLVSGPAGMTIQATTGQINWTPGETSGGQAFTFTVKATDNHAVAASSTQTYQVFVQELNSSPVFGSVAPQNINELSSMALLVQASDADLPANTLTYRFVGSVPAGMQIESATGRILWTPSEAQGPATYEVTVEAEDNGSPSLKAQKVVNITVQEVNQSPVMTAIPAQATIEGTLWSYQLVVTDPDLPANSFTYSLSSQPAGMTVSSTGLISWTPTESQGPGTFTVTAMAFDNGTPAKGALQTFTITVSEGNSAPTMAVITDTTVNELSLLSIQTVASDSDTPAQTLTYRFIGTVPAGLVVNASGLITWTPTEAQGPGSYPVTVEVSDGVAATSRGFTITVNEANAEPVLGSISNVTVIEGLKVQFVVSATDPDSPAQSLTYSLDPGAPAGATINENTGAFEWITSESSPNNNSLIVRVTDNGVPPVSATKSFTITVVEVATNVVDLVSGVAVTNTSRYTNSIVADIYRLNVTGTPTKLLFEAFNLQGDGDLLVRRGAHPTATQFDYSSTMMDTNREQVVVTGSNLSGEWFATVINRENTNIVYSISGTIPVEVAGGAMLVSTEGIKVEAPVFTPSDVTPEFSWTAVQGEKYQVEVSADLSTWTPLTSIVVNGTTATFTDPTPYTDSALRFYRIRQLPQ
jgi:subtilisin-like proprotein convertase family protein